MGLRDSAIRGVFFNWIGQFGSLVIALLLTPFLVRTLGDPSFGLWSILMGLTGYYSVANAGLHDTAAKYIAQFEHSGETLKVRQVISTLTVFYCLIALPTMLVAGCFAWVFPYLFDLAGHRAGLIRAVILIIALNFAIQMAAKPLKSALSAMARFDLLNALNFGSQLMLAVIFVLILKSGGGLLEMAWATLGVGILTQLVQFWMAAAVLKMNPMTKQFADTELAKKLLSFGSGLFVSSSAMRVADSSGVILVGMLAGPAASAFFSIGNSLVSKSDSLLQGIRSVVLPVACRASDGRRERELIQMAVVIPRVLLAMSITFTIGAVVFGRSLMDLWIEPGYADNVYAVFCLLALALAAQQIAGGHRAILIAQARIRFLAWFNITEMVLLLGLGSYLTYVFGLIGMGVAILVVRLGHGLALSSYTCRLLGFSWATFILRTMVPCLLAGLLTLAAALGVSIVMFPNNIWILIMDLLIVGAAGAASLFSICLPPDVRAVIIRALVRKSGLKKPDAATANRMIDSDSSVTSKVMKK